MNIAEILKNVPKGTKLYSPTFGKVKFKCIYNDKIVVEDSVGIERLFHSNGNFYVDGECILFPSRENRDWSAVKVYPFKKGDILIAKSGKPFIFKEVRGELCEIYCGIDTSNIFWKHSDSWTYLSEVRKATEEEIKLFLERLRKEGFEWDNTTLSLKEIKKFDINTLKPFDKVLCRDYNNEVWKCDIFSHSFVDNHKLKFKCIGTYWLNCIPYNDETKHLVGTDKDCPEYYKTW